MPPGIGILGGAWNPFFALIAVGLDAAATRFSSKFEKTAAAVATAFVGIGLLAGSLSLLAEPVQTGPFPNQVKNVCAPVVSSITVTDDGSAGFRVSVSLLDGWDMFRQVWDPSQLRHRFYGYKSETKDAVRHNPLRREDFFTRYLRTADYDGRDVHFDYFARGGTGGEYFEMEITPEWFGLQHVRGEHYHTLDSWVKITLHITDRDSKGKRLPAGKYNMHCWVSDSDGNGYYVTVYFGGEAFF